MRLRDEWGTGEFGAVRSGRWGGGVLGLLGGLAGVHEEVDVALAVAEFDVFEAVVLVGEGEEGLGEEAEGGDVEGGLAGAGDEEVATDADVVAEVEEFGEGELVFADVVAADVDLEALAGLLELGEAGFALDADLHETAGDGGFDAVGFEGLGGGGSGAGDVLVAERGDVCVGGPGRVG